MRHPLVLLGCASLLLLSLGACDAARPIKRNTSGGTSSVDPACTRCHGTPGVNAAPPNAVSGATSTSDVRVGAHQAHLVDLATRAPLTCNECHLVPDTVDAAGHMDKDRADVVFDAAGSTGIARAKGAAPSWDRTTRRCSDVYCHGSKVSGGSATAPEWTTVDGSQRRCESCHGFPPPSPSPADQQGLLQLPRRHRRRGGPHPGERRQAHQRQHRPLRQRLHRLPRRREPGHRPRPRQGGTADWRRRTDEHHLAGGRGSPAAPRGQQHRRASRLQRVPRSAEQSQPRRRRGGARLRTARVEGNAGRVDARRRDLQHLLSRPHASRAAEDQARLDTGRWHAGRLRHLPSASRPSLPTRRLATTPSPATRATPPPWTRPARSSPAAASTSTAPFRSASTTPAGWTDPAQHGHAANRNLPDCKTCHGADLAGGSVGVACASCHTGPIAFSCVFCHGTRGGLTLADAAPPLGTQGETSTTELAVGAHRQHLTDGPLRAALACTDCHTVPTSVLHATGSVEFAWSPGLAAAGGTSPRFDAVTGTCASTYCHGATLGGGSNTEPVWTTVDGSQAACGTCHGLPPPASTGHVQSTPAVSATRATRTSRPAR